MDSEDDESLLTHTFTVGGPEHVERTTPANFTEAGRDDFSR